MSTIYKINGSWFESAPPKIGLYNMLNQRPRAIPFINPNASPATVLKQVQERHLGRLIELRNLPTDKILNDKR